MIINYTKQIYYEYMYINKIIQKFLNGVNPSPNKKTFFSSQIIVPIALTVTSLYFLTSLHESDHKC